MKTAADMHACGLSTLTMSLDEELRQGAAAIARLLQLSWGNPSPKLLHAAWGGSRSRA